MKGSMEEIVKLIREWGPESDLPSGSEGYYECRRCGREYHIDDTHTTVDLDGTGPTCDLDDGPPLHLVDTDLHYVAVYAISQGYGGPEEGGWWYEQGEIERHFAVKNLSAALRLKAALSEVYPVTGKSTSVLGGEDWRIYISDRPFEPYYPRKRPHYE